MTLTERIAAIDPFMARKYTKLDDHAAMLAAEGITRLLNACERVGTTVDSCAIREIIEDAERGRQVWKEKDGQVTGTRAPVGTRVVSPRLIHG